jgi:hypothetical protein
VWLVEIVAFWGWRDSPTAYVGGDGLMGPIDVEFEPLPEAPELLLRKGAPDPDTYFACRSCGTVCSSLSRYCAACGVETDFEAVYADAMRASGVLAAKGPIGEPTKIDLARFGADSILSMVRFRGFLLLGTEHAGLVVLNAAKPSAQVTARFLEGEIVHGVFPVPGNDTRQVYLLAESGVHVLDFLPEPHVVDVSGIELTSHERGKPPAFVGFIEAGVIVFDPLSADGPTRLTLIPFDESLGRSTEEVSGVASQPITLNDGGFAFFTRSSVVTCAPSSLTLTQVAVRDALDSSEQLHRGLAVGGCLVVPALEDLRLFDPKTGALNPFGPDLKEPFLLFSGWNKPWLVALDQEGVKIIDSRTGKLLGDSRTQLNFSMAKYPVAPAFGDSSMFFIALMANSAVQLVVAPLRDDGRVDVALGVQSLYNIGFGATSILPVPSGILVAEVARAGCTLTRVRVRS